VTESVWVAGVGMTRFGVRPEATVKDLTREAVTSALADAGAEISHIEAAYFGNTCQDVLEGQVVIPGQIALRAMGVEGIPVVNVENACATGATALHQAIMHVRSGAADVVLAVGVEKLHIGDRGRSLRVFDGGLDVHDPDAASALLADLDAPAVKHTDSHSVFVDIYAGLAHHHMETFGTTAQQLALIAEKNHANSVDNPLAHFRKPITAEEILAARVVSGPLTVPMCAPLTDGGAAVLVCNTAGRRRLGLTNPVRLLASVSRTGSARGLSDWERAVSRLAAEAAYEQAGVGPDDVSVAEVHDASSFGELLQTELIGLCEIGCGGKFAESGASSLGGRLPVNPSGGLESKGHPMGASGLAQVYELVQQLRGNCGSRQVAGARIAIAESSGGFIGSEEAVAALTILAA
jgi:acetyl-CoA acyltransferase